MKEPLYQFTSHALCFQFYDVFATHFYSHQFGIVTKGGCEIIIHDIKCTLNFHGNWVILQLDVAKAFNLVLKGIIFQRFYAIGGNIIQFIPFVCAFVCAFYAFEFPLFYIHHNHEGNVIIIPFAMGILQGDPLGWALFTLAHLKGLRSIINCFPSYIFPSITNATHIIGPPSIVSSAYEHF
jgi:hypothetical protein